jgi:hypothetical protein
VRPQARIRIFTGGAGAPTSGTLHLSSFLSPDGNVWCVMAAPSSRCFTGGNPRPGRSRAQRGATIAPDGTVTLCFVAVPSVRHVCVQNWDANAPVLQRGQRTERSNVRCVAAVHTITCTSVRGPARGKGFRISTTRAARVGA